MKESAKLIIVAIVLTGCLFVSESMLAEKNRSPEQKPKRGPWVQKFVDYNKYISGHIDDTAEGIDLFISRKKKSKAYNESTITLRTFGSHFEGGEMNNSFNFDVNLRLPNLEEKWAIRFTDYDQNQEERGIRNQQQRLQGREERNYGAALALFQELGSVKTTFQPRIQLTDPLQTSYTIRLESSADMTPLKIDPRLELFADSIRGVGQFLSLNTELSLNKDLSVVQFNEQQYENADNRLITTHGVSVSRSVGDRQGVNSTISFRSLRSTQERGFHLSDFTASMGYSSEPLRRVLIYRVGPAWSFSKGNHFKGKVGLTFEVSLIF